MSLSIKIKQIKGVKSFSLDFPLENDIYAFIMSLCEDITENLDLEIFAKKLKNRLTKKD